MPTVHSPSAPELWEKWWSYHQKFLYFWRFYFVIQNFRIMFLYAFFWYVGPWKYHLKKENRNEKCTFSQYYSANKITEKTVYLDEENFKKCKRQLSKPEHFESHLVSFYFSVFIQAGYSPGKAKSQVKRRQSLSSSRSLLKQKSWYYTRVVYYGINDNIQWYFPVMLRAKHYDNENAEWWIFYIKKYLLYASKSDFQEW